MNKFALPRRLQGIEKSVIRQVFDRARPGSINLGLGEPDLLTPDVIRRAAVKAIVEEQNGYTSHAGLPSLREKVAADYPYLEGKLERVIITGMMTHMCVDGTARAASDLGFQVIVAEDACATRDLKYGDTTVPAEHVQKAFLAALKAYGKVMKSDEILALLAAEQAKAG